jgi:hypothetical protein
MANAVCSGVRSGLALGVSNMRAIVSGGALVCGALLVGCVDQDREPVRSRPAEAHVVAPPRQSAVATMGVTNAQGVAPAPVELAASSTRADRIVALAWQQIERLERVAKTNAMARRADVDSALHDLRDRREKVLKDMRELEAQPATEPEGAFAEIDRCRDVDELQSALRASYSIVPPPASALP